MSDRFEYNGYWWTLHNGSVLYWDDNRWKTWSSASGIAPPPQLIAAPGGSRSAAASTFSTITGSGGMGPWIKRHPFATSLVTLILGFVGGVSAAPREGTTTSLDSSLAAAQADADSMRGKNSSLESQLAQLEGDNDALETELDRLNDKLEEERSKMPLPDLSGRSKGSVEKIASRNGWSLSIRKQTSQLTPGTVIAQSPSAGTEVADGSRVQITIAKAPPAPEPVEAPEETADNGAGCTPGYSPCLPPASDYDCSSGTGDGPKYTGYVTVTGSDIYDLDSDGDGSGCES